MSRAEWRAIETAPKETPVLTYRGAGLMAVAERIEHPHDFGHENSREMWCCTDGVALVNVTYWMPLPDPPAEATTP